MRLDGRSSSGNRRLTHPIVASADQRHASAIADGSHAALGLDDTYRFASNRRHQHMLV
jgi:hypothetical protein